jgi:hypothetical protein
MSDISKCKGEQATIVCPKRSQCHRYTAPANEHRQSYFMSPFKMHIDGTFAELSAGDCEKFWPNDEVS